MKLAEQVKKAISEKYFRAFSLYAGYGIDESGNYFRFPVGVMLKERKNDSGRTTYTRYRYADGSELEFCYFTNSDRFTFTVR